MKIASYNLWNSSRGMPGREKQIINELNHLDADIIGLQEISSKKWCDTLAVRTNYTHYCYMTHEGETEGLSIFSKYPIVYQKQITYALMAVIEFNGYSILITNLHLPWKSIITKENGIVNIIKEISMVTADYKIILGDFNCNENSSVQRYLKGQQSLKRTEVIPYWTDLTEVATETLGIERQATLDLKTNPRWNNVVQTDISTEVDKIFIKDSHPNPYMSLTSFNYFGKEVDSKTGWCPSDHYGVCAELKLPNK